jgi:SAM-dependent methyltransferase
VTTDDEQRVRHSEALPIYDSLPNAGVLARIPRGTRRLLDVGCGTGRLGAWVKREWQSEVTGISHSEVEATMAAKHLDQVLVCDLEKFQPSGIGEFDCIVCSHVLEHLRDPRQLLVSLGSALSEQGLIVIALPNILFWKQRWQFLMGEFRYTDYGILDRTHLRFYDWVAAKELICSASLHIESAEALGSFPGSRLLGSIGPWVNRMTLPRWPGLLGHEFVFVCAKNVRA